MNQRPKQRLVFIDLINVIAIMFVVFLHLRVSYFNPQDTPAWWVENALSGFGVMAVPLFLMNTGVTVLDFAERESTRTFFAKRATKVLVPYLVWGQLYYLLRHFDGGVELTPRTAFVTLFAGSTQVATLWYLEMLMGIYLVIPLLSWALTALRASGRDPIRYAAGAAAIAAFASAILPTIRFFVPTFLPELVMPFGQGFIVYVLLGYVLSKVVLPTAVRVAIYVAGACSVLTFVFVGAHFLLSGSAAAALVTDYLSVSTLVASIAVFTAGHQLRTDAWPPFLVRGLAWMSGLTFGIYLVHIMVMTVLGRWLPLSDPQAIVGSTLIVWAVSAVAVAGLRLIPPVKRWVVP